MNFHNDQHQFYCWINLHAKQRYDCVMEQRDKIHLRRNIRNDAHYFLKLLDPYSSDVVVGAECIYNWYWLADF